MKTHGWERQKDGEGGKKRGKHVLQVGSGGGGFGCGGQGGGGGRSLLAAKHRRAEGPTHQTMPVLREGHN